MQRRSQRKPSRLPRPEDVLALILEAQNGQCGPSFQRAFKEISKGRKSSCWIWYIWPCLGPLRPTTSRPQYLLHDWETVLLYLQHPDLLPRLVNITVEAIAQMQSGVTPLQLLGATDRGKLAETCTFFACACRQQGMENEALVFEEALDVGFSGELDERTMAVLVGEWGLQLFEQCQSTQHLQEFGIDSREF
eukprot:TRINITY_DN56100_c0_g1_i2.p2 TRINITY_DN56100_c0_g1~~TRINITY_DN56100_c0_g1_i2.p2  ORF type:complete len:192 (+),score=37.17 TRINITY_DN56100_c0_g1_i2:197-772(+)